MAEEDQSGRINKAKPLERYWVPSALEKDFFFYVRNAGTLEEIGHTTVKESKNLSVETPHLRNQMQGRSVTLHHQIQYLNPLA